MRKCFACHKKEAEFNTNGNWFCNDCINRIIARYRFNDINKKLYEHQMEMLKSGLKQHTLKWSVENVKWVKKNIKGNIKPDIIGEYKNFGIMAAIRVFLAFYILT